MKAKLQTLCLLCGFAVAAHAQTIVSGNISGTWTPSGNPYIVTDNAQVPSGQTLIVQAGVIVWVADGVAITVNGGIQAAGTSLQHITFQAPTEDQLWNGISVYSDAPTLFSYCDFRNTLTPLGSAGSGSKLISNCTFESSVSALILHGGNNVISNCTFESSVNALSLYGGNNEVNNCTFNNITNTALSLWNHSSNHVMFSTFQNVSNGIVMIANYNNNTLVANIDSCVISNCLGVAISGVGDGRATSSSSYSNGKIVSEIKHCIVSSAGYGCSFDIFGGQYCYYTSCREGYGMGDVKIQNSIFNNITNTAISLTAGGFALASPAQLINNVIVNADSGVLFEDPWDAKMENSIVAGCTSAVTVSGALSRYVQYNNFFNNIQNFIGYPSAYGDIILINRNGTPCDLLFNIFSDPLFVSTNSFALQTNSPCIDAGEGSASNYDSYFPPSQGGVINDIGAYGGPNAGGWYLSPPSPSDTFTLSSERLTYIGVTINPPTVGHYRLEYSTNLVSPSNWIQITNMDLSGPFYYVEPAHSPERFYRASKLY